MSRLDRLVLLLDTGTSVVRNTAAEQLAQIQKAHPDELYNLLGRIVPFLKSNQWDTRVAASKAIGGIVENLSLFDPNAVHQVSVQPDEAIDGQSSITEEDVSVNQDKVEYKNGAVISSAEPAVKLEDVKISTDESDIQTPVEDEDTDKLNFSDFDITNVIKNGRALLGSAGKEYDWNMADLNPEERLARAKHSVTARLGLGAEYMEKDFLSAQDLATPSGSHQSPLNSGTNTPAHIAMPPPTLNTPHESAIASPGTPVGEDGLSARQRNMMKRKAKTGSKMPPNKVRLVDVSSNVAGRRSSQSESNGAVPAPMRKDGSSQDYFSVTPQAQNDSKIVVEHKAPPKSPSALLHGQSSSGWPLDGLVELLVVDIFDPRWETRHGAALALRDLLRTQASGAGREQGRSLAKNDELNKAYLDDLACRLCCVFALDRFGDYVSDQVVAPIRETVSQTLAALLKHLSDESVKATFSILTSLVFQRGLPVKAWEVTHGGMLGLKYLVAIRKDILLSGPEFLDGIILAVLHSLADQDDDVRAVGAATLIPIAAEFVDTRSDSVSALLDVLWDCLADLRDDLSASTGSVMDLLAKLCSMDSVLDVMKTKSAQESAYSFAMLVPRLYPFLRHTITSVRRAVLRALLTFLKADSEAANTWIDSKFLRLLFQNLLVEQNSEVLSASQELWQACIKIAAAQDSLYTFKIFSSCLPICVSLVMTPIGHGRNNIPMEASSFIRPSGQHLVLAQSKVHEIKKEPPSKVVRRKKEDKHEEIRHSHNIDTPMIQADLQLVGVDNILRTRAAAATALGLLISTWPAVQANETLLPLVETFTHSAASSPRYMLAILVEAYADDAVKKGRVTALRNIFSELNLSKPPSSYQNLTPLLHIVRGQCQALCNAFIDTGRVSLSKIPSLAVVCRGDPDAGPSAFDVQVAERLVGEDYDRLRQAVSSQYRGQVAKNLEDARESVVMAIATLDSVKTTEDVRVLASYAGAYISLGELPKKLNPIIKALMDSIKKEDNSFMQRRSAHAIASLVQLCSSSGRGTAADKLIKNLCAFLCVDTSETPEFHRHSTLHDVIYSLRKDEEVASVEPTFIREAREAKIKHAGAQMALEEMSLRFKANLFKLIPKLADCIFAPLRSTFTAEASTTSTTLLTDSNGQDLIDGLCVLRALVASFEESLFSEVFDIMPLLLQALQCEFSSIRHAAASCFAHICKVRPFKGMQIAINDLIPMLADAGHLWKRQGAIEAISLAIVCMDVTILPYVIFLIVPVLGRMSDSNNDVRIVATTAFAMLVKLVPLEAGIPDPPGFSKEMLAGRDNERKFIQQMLDGSKVEQFTIPVAIKADLRSYQQDGVNWLAFLNRYQLHGILCDDMGLGKTLQTICIVASDHHLRRERYRETALEESRPLPSLIVCPPSLSGHWLHELNTYAPFLTCVTYVGYPPERKSQRATLHTVDVIITSYDIARNDIEVLSKMNFNYCVLDEGHIIKNSRAKLTQSVKLLKANHRLILSGTPIQNNVLELWSLFDFLMPGFLGTEKTFYDRYAKPIANSRDSKSSSKEQEAGALALEALHKQVLPFLLRRLKEDVLADLPPKIIQDYYCELSPLQKSLYTDFAASQATMVAEQTAGEMKKENKTHVFQALQYMRKLCNHPALVLNERHPKYAATIKDLARQSQTIRDVQHAPKLLALRDLLLDCGIGATMETTGNGQTSNMAAQLGASVVNQHRVLIFCQIKDMLDMVENDVLKKLLPTVSYIRLDGTTDPRNRQAIVQEFNADPSIDVLLLTTHVGGLGLNLTGADTVIFVEHDWNPMKDLQAMDRAHRIGQKKTVNVYRLITRGTLEEKIMGLQKFKMNIASTIVNQQNSGLATMETDQILDLFNVGEEKVKGGTKEGEGGVDSQGNIIKKGQKSVFDDLDALHDEGEYADFDVDTFVQSL